VDLQYVTRAAIEKTRMLPQPETVVVVDEAQDIKAPEHGKLIEVLEKFQVNSLVVYEHGNYTGAKVHVPDKVDIRPYKDFDGVAEKRTLIVHADKSTLPAQKGDVFVIQEKLAPDIETFKRIKSLKAFQLHCCLHHTIGLHIDLDVVYAPMFVCEKGRKRDVTVMEHFQLACRLGRFGKSGIYYGCGNLRDLTLNVKPKFSYRRDEFRGSLSFEVKKPPAYVEPFPSFNFPECDVKKSKWFDDSFVKHVVAVETALPLKTIVVWNDFKEKLPFRQPVYMHGGSYTWLCNDEDTVMSFSIAFLVTSLERGYLDAVDWHQDSGVLAEFVACFITLYTRLILEAKGSVLKKYSRYGTRDDGGFGSAVVVLKRFGLYFSELVNSNECLRCFTREWRSGAVRDLKVLIL
jgi:hypothetical protein